MKLSKIMEKIKRPSVYSMEKSALAWCTDKTKKLVMNTDLAFVFAEILDKENKPNLGLATTNELIQEIKARIEMDGKLYYRTVDGD